MRRWPAIACAAALLGGAVAQPAPILLAQKGEPEPPPNTLPPPPIPGGIPNGTPEPQPLPTPEPTPQPAPPLPTPPVPPTVGGGGGSTTGVLPSANAEAIKAYFVARWHQQTQRDANIIDTIIAYRPEGTFVGISYLTGMGVTTSTVLTGTWTVREMDETTFSLTLTIDGAKVALSAMLKIVNDDVMYDEVSKGYVYRQK